MELIEQLRSIARARHRDAASTAAEQDLRRDVLRLGLPSVGEQVLALLVSVVNTMLAGHLGSAAVTAVGIAGSISFLAGTFFTAVATGATALIAQSIGANDRPYANRILEQSMLLGLLLGVLSTAVLLPLAGTSMTLMGAEEHVVDLGVRYLSWISYSLPFMALLLIGSGSLRGAGDTRTPMLVMGGVNVVNAALSYILVRGLGPIPSFGVTGAGMAACVGTAIGCVAVVWLLLRGRGSLRMRRLLAAPDLGVIKSLIRIGAPAGGEALLFRLAFLAYTRTIASLGTVAYAAYLIAMRLEALSDMPAAGFAVAATTLSGQAIGAGRPDLARRYIFKSIEVSLYFSLTAGILLWTAPVFLLRLFTQEAAVIEQGILPLRIVALGLPAVAFALGLSGGLRGAGDTRIVMVSTGVGSWLVRVPLSLASVTLLHLGVGGVQASMVLDYLVRALWLGWRFRPTFWAQRMAQRLSVPATTTEPTAQL